MEYIDLEGLNTLLDLEQVDITKIKKTKTAKIALVNENAPQIEFSNESDKAKESLFGESCGIEEYYGDPSKDGYFLKENLFSELTDDYQRAIARFNLGIAEEYALKWGNITGNLENQEDLANYINSKFEGYIQDYVDSMNSLLENWAVEIRLDLDNMIRKDRVVDNNDLGNDSDMIPTTAWVNAKLGDNTEFNLKYLTLNPEYIVDVPQDIILSWDFYVEPSAIKINGLSIDTSLKEYTFNNIDDFLVIKFSYELDDKWYNRTLFLEKIQPVYYGTSENRTECTPTKNNSFLVDSGENDFVYLHIPNKINARIYANNLLGGFERSVNSTPDNYFIYKSVNNGLGEILISYDK